jgi:1-phosphofructokinase family hexose kinase
VERTVRDLLPKASWLMLCGSLPPGVPADFYGRLIAAARARKVKTLLRATGDALREGIEARPTVATPNHQEAERLLGKNLLTRTHYLEAAERIGKMGPESVVLSLASRGAIGVFADGMIEALPPRIDVVCPIGAGDAMTAGYVWAMTRKENAADALRWGVAAGTASARLPGLKFANREQTQEMYRQVEVRRIE